MKYLKALGFFVLVMSFSVNALAVTSDKVGKPLVNPLPDTTNEPQLNQTSGANGTAQITNRKNNIIPAKIKRCPKPEYPTMARRLGMEGTAMVDVLIDENGKVTSTKLLTSSGFEILDKTTLEYFYQCEFFPSTEEGKPIAAWTRKKMNWKLEDEGVEGSVLGVRLSGQDDAKPFSNIRNEFSRDCGDLVHTMVESINSKFTNQKFSQENVCHCIDDKIFSDKTLKAFFDKTTKEIRETYDHDNLSNYFMGKTSVSVFQCVSEELARNISEIDVKKKL